MADEKNEFESLDVEGDEKAPEQTLSEVPSGNESMISAGAAGVAYDWQNLAPEGTKAPPRENLNEKTVTIKKTDIILPPLSKAWELTKAGDKEFKYCTFVLYYDVNSQQEFYSGVRVFNREGKYSHPTITRDRNNQASKLLGKYSDFKKKDINEVSLKEFMSFLNSQPKVKIATGEVTNPQTNEVIIKNFVGTFVNP